jgi:hypothetical protein
MFGGEAISTTGEAVGICRRLSPMDSQPMEAWLGTEVLGLPSSFFFARQKRRWGWLPAASLNPEILFPLLLTHIHHPLIILYTAKSHSSPSLINPYYCSQSFHRFCLSSSRFR